MDIDLLKNYINKRIGLTDKYPQYKGRHMFFNSQLKKINRGFEILDKHEPLEREELDELNQLGKLFIKIRGDELKSHNSRFNTEIGNEIHQTEFELYSMALDVFQTYGTMY